VKRFLIITLAIALSAASQLPHAQGLVTDSLHGVLHVPQRTTPPQRVRLGNEDIRAIYEACSRARVAVVANQTSVIGEGLDGSATHLVDTLLALGVDVKKVFAPEHGFRGNQHNGANISDSTDPKTGLPILSLHGAHKKPTPESLQDVRMILFDIQDVGARFYTYLSTLFLVMEAAAENGQVVVVLDRPNPHGHQIAGPVIDSTWMSFVGRVPVPVLHGMTFGEMARMFNGEKWLRGGITCDLIVIPCKGYAHSDAWYPTIAPSPNLPTAASIALYPSLCPFEPTEVSIGRGTTHPFECVGLPIPTYGSFVFTPKPVEGAAPHPKHQGLSCSGQNLQSLGNEWMTSSAGFDWSLVPEYANIWAQGNSDEPFIANESQFNKLVGNRGLTEVVNQGSSFDAYRMSWLNGLHAFEEKRRPYLLYPVQRMH